MQTSEPSYAQYIARPWQCPMCKEEFVSTGEEKQKHLIACNIPAEEMDDTGVEQKVSALVELLNIWMHYRRHLLSQSIPH